MEEMIQPVDLATVRIERENRLRWQSGLLLGLVILPVAAGLTYCIARMPTFATLEGIIICALFGILVWCLRAATPWAALTGFLLTACIYLGTVEQPDAGWLHTALLTGLSLFVLAFAATRFRRRDKELHGIAESRRGRGASQVAANMGTAALFATLILGLTAVSGRRPALILAMVAALAEAAADTVSSEIGQVLGGTPILLTTFRPVPAGTDGAISAPGTLAGGVAAVIVVLVALPTLKLDPRQAVVACFAAIGGLFADSLLGATAERRGWLNNDSVNFLSTLSAALIAFGLLRWQ